MSDDELDALELKMIGDKLKSIFSTTPPTIISELSIFIHTSLFDNRRCDPFVIPYHMLEKCAFVSPKTWKHFEKLHNHYVLTCRLLARFDKQNDDVNYVVDIGKIREEFKPHEEKAFVEVCNCFIEELNVIRQRVRIEFRSLWKKEKLERAKQTN